MPIPRKCRLAAAFVLAVPALFTLTAGCGGSGTTAKPGGAPGSAAGPADAPKAPETVLATYDRGLDWLVSQQKDGVWLVKEGVPSADFTAMAVTALFERPGGVREKDRDIAAKAIDFLVKSVDADGSVAGTQTPNYSMSVVVMALTASGRADAKPVVERLAKKIRTFQFLDRNNATYGGIGYGSDNTRSDLSNTQFALASLRAAGVSPDDKVFKDAVEFLSRTQNRKENETAGEPADWKDKDGKVYVRANDGGANYRPGDSKAGFDERPDGVRVLRSYGSMTYALLRCYHLAGLPASDGRVKAAVDYISKNWMLDVNPGMPAEMKSAALFYMYATIGKTLPLAGLDTLEAGGKKIDWRADLAAHLAKIQRPDGSWKNEAESKWQEGNEVIATSFALSALSACAKK